MQIKVDSIKERPNDKIQIGLRSYAEDGRISLPQELDFPASDYNADPEALIAKFTAQRLPYFEAFEKAQPEKMGEILADPEPLRGSVVDHNSKAVLDAKAELDAKKAADALEQALPIK